MENMWQIFLEMISEHKIIFAIILLYDICYYIFNRKKSRIVIIKRIILSLICFVFCMYIITENYKVRWDNNKEVRILRLEKLKTEISKISVYQTKELLSDVAQFNIDNPSMLALAKYKGTFVGDSVEMVEYYKSELQHNGWSFENRKNYDVFIDYNFKKKGTDYEYELEFCLNQNIKVKNSYNISVCGFFYDIEIK